VGQGGEAPLKLKHFLLLNVHWKPQIRPFFSEICWKTAKNALFHIMSPVTNFHGRAKGGSHRTMPPLNTPLAVGMKIPTGMGMGWVWKLC